MSEQVADFAIFGSSPLARLLAGLLASVHSRRIVLIGVSQSVYRLPRRIDLSVGPITRPETWAMLGEGVSDTVRLLGKVAGRGAWSYVDPILFAQGTAAQEALSHIRHMAQGFRLAAEPVATSRLGSGRAGIVIRDAIRLNRPMLETALDPWLAKHQVQQLSGATITIAEDGSASIALEDQILRANQSVLVGSEAIVDWLKPAQWPALLQRQAAAAVLLTQPQPLAAPVMLEIGAGTTLLQQREGGLVAIGQGDLAGFSAHLQALLGASARLEQAGQTRFSAIATADGAPAFGRVSGNGPDIVAGLGGYGAFLAPALARWLAGEAQPHQEHWFGARLVTRLPGNSPVTDYALAPHEALA